MNSDFIDVRWYSAVDTVGVVLIWDKYMGFKCYIGSGQGIDEQADIDHIRSLGVKVDYGVAEAVFGSLMADSKGISSMDPETGEHYITFKYDGNRIRT